MAAAAPLATWAGTSRPTRSGSAEAQDHFGISRFKGPTILSTPDATSIRGAFFCRRLTIVGPTTSSCEEPL
jgi:hypothetical protein